MSTEGAFSNRNCVQLTKNEYGVSIGGRAECFSGTLAYSFGAVVLEIACAWYKGGGAGGEGGEGEPVGVALGRPWGETAVGVRRAGEAEVDGGRSVDYIRRPTMRQAVSVLSFQAPPPAQDVGVNVFCAPVERYSSLQLHPMHWNWEHCNCHRGLLITIFSSSSSAA